MLGHVDIILGSLTFEVRKLLLSNSAATSSGVAEIVRNTATCTPEPNHLGKPV